MRRGSEIYPILFQLTSNNNFLELYKANWNDIIGYSHNFDIVVRKVNFTKVIDYINVNLKEKKFLCAICKLARLEALSIILNESGIEKLKQIRAISDGVSLNNTTFCPDKIDLETISLNHLFSTYPIFTPVIGLESNEIDEFLENVSKNLVNLDYCQFKPENQVINIEIVKKLYKSLDLTDLINECLNRLEEIGIKLKS
jgi:adenylyl- and sulfurtransferase ThiI